MTFDELSDEMLGPVLDRMPAKERRKLLLLLRRVEHPIAHPWIDRQLKERRLLSSETETTI
jgi:hypothetical protein